VQSATTAAPRATRGQSGTRAADAALTCSQYHSEVYSWKKGDARFHIFLFLEIKKKKAAILQLMNFLPNTFQLLVAKIHNLGQTLKTANKKTHTFLFGCTLALSPILHKSAACSRAVLKK